jgi:dipeptidyl aminopeptidase/acylaminoacyl peptidase
MRKILGWDVDSVGDNRSPAISDDGRYIAWTYTGPDAEKSLRLAKWSDGHIDGERELAKMGAPARIDPRVTFTTVDWKSTDGLAIDGYLALPTDFERGKRYPTVVVVHGGPSGGAKPSMPEWPAGIFLVQLLTQRGYVVFQPDYRMSQRLGFDKVLAARASGQPMQFDFDDI